MKNLSIKALKQLPAMQMEDVTSLASLPTSPRNNYVLIMAMAKNQLRQQILSELKTHTTHVSNIDTLNMSKAN